MGDLFAGSISEKSQAAGAQVIHLGANDRFREHQIQVEVSEAPAAGMLTVSVRTPGASAFQDIGTIDLAGSLVPMQFNGFAAELRFTPVGFDADKTYSVFVASGAGV